MGYLKNIKTAFKPKHYLNYALVSLFLIAMVVLNAVGILKRSDYSLLFQMGYSILLAVSLNLVVGFLGELSLGHAGFMCVGAYIGCYTGMQLMPIVNNKLLILIISMIVGGVVAAVFGFIIGLPALRLKGDYLAIVTLAFGEIVRTVVKNMPFLGGTMGLTTSDIRFKTKEIFTLIVVTFIVVLIMLILVQNLIRSKHGRAVTAIRDNEIAARAMGINVTFYKLFIFVISAFFAGVAGVLYGSSVSPVVYTKFDYNYSIEILVMVVLGGMGNVTGSIISAALLTFVNVKLTALGGDLAAIKYLIYSLILIIMVMFNNAAVFAPVKQKMGDFFKAVFKRKKKPSTIEDDKANWIHIPTKIKMDAVLSTDLTADTSQIPDKPSKKGE